MAEVSIKTLMRLGPHRFIPVEEYVGPAPRAYVEGALVIAVGGVVLLDEKQWDLIDQLWYYLVEAIERLSRGEGSETYFPDDPAWLRIDVDRDGATATVTVKTDVQRQARAKTTAWLAAFGGAAIVFFERFAHVPHSGGNHRAICEEALTRLRAALSRERPRQSRRHHHR